MSGHTPWSQVKAERQARLARESFERRLEEDAATAAERLHSALGLPPELMIEYSQRPLATRDASNEPADAEDPE